MCLCVREEREEGREGGRGAGRGGGGRGRGREICTLSVSIETRRVSSTGRCLHRTADFTGELPLASTDWRAS